MRGRLEIPFVFCTFLRTDSNYSSIQHWLTGFITEMKRVYCAVRPHSSMVVQVQFSIQRIKDGLSFPLVMMTQATKKHVYLNQGSRYSGQDSNPGPFQRQPGGFAATECDDLYSSVISDFKITQSYITSHEIQFYYVALYCGFLPLRD